MTIDLTLDDIMIPALPFFTPTFGTKKAEGGLTTEEVNNNILAFFSRRRPIIIIENSDTTQVEYDANLLLNTAGLTLTLGAGTYVGCTVTVTFPAGGNLQYTSKIGVVTDTLRATASVSYVWKGTWWEAIIGKCAVDDVLFQMPDVPNPGLLYGGQWVEHPYAGMFFRSQGGNAKAFTPPIPGSFTSETVFAATSALPSSVAVGDLVIAGNEYRTITAISGQNITVDLAFSNRSNITNLIIGQPGTGLPVSWTWYGSDGVYRLHVSTYKDSSPDTQAGGSVDPDTYFIAGRRMALYEAVYSYDDGIEAQGFRVKVANITTRAWLRKA